MSDSELLKSVVNPCFPRSGHRFLRNLCGGYFRHSMRFASIYKADASELEAANYVKDHDFGCIEEKRPFQIADDKVYLVQYRHPLESIASYFEFAVFHGNVQDTESDWNAFFSGNLTYWMRFVQKWCLDDAVRDNPSIKRVVYKDLYDNPRKTLSEIIEFVSVDGHVVDQRRLDATIEKNSQGFARYIEQEKEGERALKSARKVREFKYFSEVFEKTEQEMTEQYLVPLKLDRLFS